MAYAIADRVFETSTSTGTGSFNLIGSTTGFQTFVAGVGDGNTCNYEINNGTDWEIGIGTITSGSPDVLSRDTVTASSNSGAKVNWGSGTKNVFLPMIASNTVITAKENTFAANQKIDSIQTTGSSGIALKNSAGATALTIGASAGIVAAFAGAVTVAGSLGVTGKTNTAASATGGAGLNIPHGTAPTTPADGDVWTTTSGMYARVNGVTKQIDQSFGSGCSLYQTTGTTIGGSVWATLGFDTENYDDDSWHDTSTNNSRITVDFTGRINLIGTVDYNNASGSAVFAIRLLKNGSVVKYGQDISMAVGLGRVIQEMSGDFACTSGDYFELQCYSNLSSRASGAGATGTTFTAKRIK